MWTLYPINILVIDDDKTISEVLRKIIQSAGKSGDRVFCVGGIEELKNIYVHNEDLKIDLAFVDYYLPMSTGFEIINFLKSKNVENFAMLTSANEMDIQIEAFNLGVIDFIKKPFSVRDILFLVDSIKRGISKKNTRDEIHKKLLEVEGKMEKDKNELG